MQVAEVMEMGERAYIIRKDNGTWKAAYSHWGAGYLYAKMEEMIKEFYDLVWESYKDKKAGQELTKFDAFGRLEDSINELWKYETEEKGGEVKEIEKPSEFIDWSDIIIEAWVVYEPKKFIAIYRPVILNTDKPVGVTLTLEKPEFGKLDSSNVIRVLDIFLKAYESAKTIAYALKDNLIGELTAEKMARTYLTRDSYDVTILNYVRIVIFEPKEEIKARIDRRAKLLLW